jgi:hypothetical protein
LSAISADLGSITAGTITSITLASNTITGGTITGTTFKTAVSGLRVEIDSTNGLRIYDAGGTLTAQLNGWSLTFGAGLIDGSALTNSTITAGKLNVSTLSAISANLGTITAGSIDSNTITGGTITGTTVTGGIVQTAVVGNNRVYMDSTNGLLLLDSSDVTHVQINASVYAGILLNGLRSIDTNDIFMEANDQSVQLFVSQASGRVSFAMAGATRGYFDSSDGSGAGNQPTSLVVRVNGALQRVNRASSGGFLYI